MKQEINPKTAAIVIGILAVVVLFLGYKLFFARPTTPLGPAYQPGNQRLLHPMGPDNPLPRGQTPRSQ